MAAKKAAHLLARLNLKKFHVLFPLSVGVLILVIIFLQLSVTYLYPCGSKIELKGTLDPKSRKGILLSYRGDCNLKLSFKDQQNLQFWLYKPDKSIDLLELSKDESWKIIQTAGNYQLSVKNTSNLRNNFHIVLMEEPIGQQRAFTH